MSKPRYLGSVRFFKNLILLAVIIMILVPTGFALRYRMQLSDLMQTDPDRSACADISASDPEGSASFADSSVPTTDDPGSSPDVSASQPAASDPVTQDPDSSAGQVQYEQPAYQSLYPDFYAPQDYSATQRDEGVIYLTFDDGPSARTPEILEILREENVKATFFVVGKTDAKSQQWMRDIVAEGHTLAMHSYSHNYSKIYASVEDYLADMYQIFTQIKEATGVAPTLFRFPGGSINAYNRGIYQQLLSEMLRRGFVPFDWNLSTQDAASSGPVPVDTILSNVLDHMNGIVRGVVLMHDSASKTTTVQALPTMIRKLRDMGYTFDRLTPDTLPVLYGYRE